MPYRKVIKTIEAPEGLLYVPQFLSAIEEQALVELVCQLDFYDFVLQGYTAKRKVKHFGYSYEFYTSTVTRLEAFPQWLMTLRNRAAPLANLDPERLDQALVAYYPGGAAIGWHRDAPAFGNTVLGISLASEETMRFRKETESEFIMYKQPLARGSLYVLSGAARSVWQHSLPPAKQARYSITFRTVRGKYLP